MATKLQTVRVITKGQREQIIRWWVPSILSNLKKKCLAPVLYFRKLSLTAAKPWVSIGDTGICFPLAIEKITPNKKTSTNTLLGFVLIMQTLDSVEASDVRSIIDNQIQSAMYAVCNSTLQSNMSSIASQGIDLTRPLLIQEDTEERIQKQAHHLYLQSGYLAFLSLNELNWGSGMFQKLQGAFVCIPSFYRLSTFQQDILRKELRKPLPCVLVLGMRLNELPPKDIRLFLQAFPLCI